MEIEGELKETIFSLQSNMTLKRLKTEVNLAQVMVFQWGQISVCFSYAFSSACGYLVPSPVLEKADCTFACVATSEIPRVSDDNYN